MNTLKIKFIGLLVILLFCLSPLSAIDFNHVANVPHNNNINNSFNIKKLNNAISVNDTIESNDSDAEIKGINETDDASHNENDDASHNENDVVIQNLSKNDSNYTPNLKIGNLGLHAKIDDCYYGNYPVLKVWCTDKGFIKGYFDINVTGPGYSEVYRKFFRQEGEFKLRPNLTPGTYTVTVHYVGDSDGENKYYDDAQVTDFFTVHKLKVNIKAHVDDVEYGEKPVLKFTCPDGLKGNITISPNFTNDNIVFDASKGSFEYEFDEDLAPGPYNCIVYYSGDGIHDCALSGAFFNVNKHVPDLNASQNDTCVNQKEDLGIKANASNETNVVNY